MDSQRRLKRLDAFPKTLEDFRVKTCGGALVGAVSGLTAVLLFFSQLQYRLAREVSLVQTQLAPDCCAKTRQELSDLQHELSCSLAAVVREPKAAVPEAETRKLGQPLNL